VFRNDAHRRDAGFTLVEIAFAILILAGSMVVLLGLQSSLVRREVADKNRQDAMLIARRVMAAVESLPDFPENGTRQGSARQILVELLTDKVLGDRDEILDRYQVEMGIQNWGIPELNDRAMRSLALKVYWSDYPLDAISLVYFVPAPDVHQQ